MLAQPAQERDREFVMWCGVMVQLPVSSGRSRLPASAGSRIESCPPARGETRPSWKQRVRAWLSQALAGTGAPTKPTEPTGATPLVLVRLEFATCLDDIHTRHADDLLQRIRRARSLRDLWHLRTDVFNVVSHHAGQHEARTRLARLNRHFPSRAPRSSFAPL
jgi:hypothetical protein